MLDRVSQAIRSSQAQDLVQNRALLVAGILCLGITLGVVIYLVMRAKFRQISNTEQAAPDVRIPLNRV